MNVTPYIIVNALITNEGRQYRGYVAVDPPFIRAVGEGNPPTHIADCGTIIDAHGAMLLPGAIDTHVHFRDPGLTHKASIKSESASALAGGVTSFLDMPNTLPPATSVEAINQKKQIAATDASANYGFFAGVTNTNIDQIMAIDPGEIPGLKLFMGSSTGNMLVDDNSTINRLFSQYKGVIAVHAEDEATIARNRQMLQQRYGDAAHVSLHPQLRSADACYIATNRAVSLARQHNTRLHVCHISTADELQLFTRGNIADKRITAETCPHYLWFGTPDDPDDSRLRKCNPSIKSDSDRDALRRALVDGLIDTVATDHAPHLLDEKQGSLWQAASGMPGVRFLIPLMLELTHVVDGLTATRVVELTAHNPATLFGIDRRGFIRPGYYADLILVRPDSKPVEITQQMATEHLPADSIPGCRWTPYAGIATRYLNITTILNGTIAYDSGHVLPEARNAAMPLRFNHSEQFNV